MKTSKLLSLLGVFAAAAFVAIAADAPATPAKSYTVTLSEAHVCCGSCVKTAAAAVANLKGVTAIASIDKKTIDITAPDKATAQKAMDDLTAAGFYGKSSDAAIKVNGDTGAKNEMVSSMVVDNLHLCCGSCVKTVNAVLADVPGYKANDAKQGAKSFTITGNVNPTVVFAAFQKAGLTGKLGATKPAAAPAPASKS